MEAQHTAQFTNTNTAPAASTRPQLLKLVTKKPPTRFNGDPAKLQNWLFEVKQFLELAGFQSENDKAKYVVSLLEGKAQTWWRGFSQTASGDLTRLDFEDLEEYLVEQFEDVDRELKLRRKLKNLKQLTSVQNYVNEFRRVQLELGSNKLDDGAAQFEFLEGLKDAVRQQVLLGRPMSLEDAILLAERADAAIMFNRSYGGGGNSGFRGASSLNRNRQQRRNNGGYDRNRNNNSSGYAPMDIDTVQGGSAHDQNQRGGSARGRFTCYYCGKAGHVKKKCFKLQRDQQQQKQQGSFHAMELPPPPPQTSSDEPKN